jgi:hypothetical protein
MFKQSKHDKMYFQILYKHLPLPPPKGDVPLWRGQGEVEMQLLLTEETTKRSGSKYPK